jgi:hypothetical protein
MLLNTRLRAALLVPLAQALLAGCTDSASAPTDVAARTPRRYQPESPSLERATVRAAHVIITARRFDARTGRAIAAYVDTASYAVAWGSDGSATASVELDGSRAPVRIAESSRIARRDGAWQRSLSPSSGRSARSVRFRAAGGAPPHDVEFVEAGVAAARVTSAWERSGDTWRLRSRTFIQYARGRPVSAVEWVFDVAEQDAHLRAAAALPIVSVSRGEVAVAESTASSSAAAAPADEVCEAELRAMEDAFWDYEEAVLTVGACAFKNPVACTIAIIDLADSWHDFTVAADRLEECLRKY